jgi:murein hydrolase activator
MVKKIYCSKSCRILLSSLLWGLVVLGGSLYAIGEPSGGPHQEEVEKIERKLLRERKELNRLDAEQKDLLGKLSGIEREVTEKRAAISDLQLTIQTAGNQVNALKEELAHLRKASMDAEQKISHKLVQFYKHVRIRYLKALTDVRDMGDFLRRLKYFSIVVAQDKTDLLTAADQAEAHQDAARRTEARLDHIKTTIQKEEVRLGSLKKELDEKVLLLVSIYQEKKFYETAVRELEAAAQGLKETFIDIEKNEGPSTIQSCHFEDYKGKLPYPVKGKVMKGPGLSPAGTETYKGIIIEVTGGPDVQAVFPGRVAFSGEIKGYGQLVIVNHGSRFFTVSANLSKRTKVEGEQVKTGDVVGRLNGNGASQGGRLYFEIRRAGKGLNPMEWLSPQ